MTMYIVANALAHKQVNINELVPISEKAWRMDGSRMFVKVGDKVPVYQLIQGIVVASGNDASVAMAEFLGGSEESFADVMNQQARLLGMNDSHFTDATGMPNPEHYTTAADLAKVAQATIRYFPQMYAIYAQKSFLYNNINQPNRNQLLWRDPSVDGLKTGHTDEAGYCLVASAKRGNMRLISVIMGAPSERARTEDSQKLLNYGFRFYETMKLVSAGKPIHTEPVWYGDKDVVAMTVPQDLVLTLPRGQFANVKVKMQIATPIEAPLKKGQKLGTLQIVKNNQVLQSAPLVAATPILKGGIFSRMKDSVSLRMDRWFGSDSPSKA
jgi:D-alanyl-D-alanine carboxypeptidase (penicillin-binding protein 5/6)